MEQYSIQFTKSAQKELSRIPKKDQLRVITRIQELSKDPRPVKSKKLTNEEKYRVRQGNYRILYQIKDEELIIVLVKIRHRKEAYE